MADDLSYISAADALAKFRSKDLSPVELMSAVIKRCERVDPNLNALTQMYFEEAMQLARKAEDKYQNANEPIGALEGLPIAVKEDKGVKGKPTSAGSVVFKDNIAGSNALPVERILKAGGIIHARTNVCEMGATAISGGKLFPPTKNPWNETYNSGGSSGGAGASLAAGMTTLANGSDYCGSIRIPASACGVVGFKGPRGRNPVSPFFNLDWYDHDGPMARTVADCALFQNAMSGQHPADPFSLRDSVTIPDHFKSIKDLKIAVSYDLGFFAVSDEVLANTRTMVKCLQDLGVQVIEVALPWISDVLTAYKNHSATIFGSWIAPYLADHRAEMTDYAIALGEYGQRVTARDFYRSIETEAEMWESLGPIFETFDALICPTLAVPSVPLHHDPTSNGLAIGDAMVDADFGWCMTFPFNMISTCPVLSIPSGFAASGVPTGVQIVGRPYDDVTPFRIGSALEGAQSENGWDRKRPNL